MNRYARAVDYDGYHWDSDDILYEKIGERLPQTIWIRAWDDIREEVETAVSHHLRWPLLHHLRWPLLHPLRSHLLYEVEGR